MTVFTFGGPVLIGYVLGGGDSPRWPPDRPVEWATFLGVSAMVVILMMACLALSLINRRAMVRKSATSDPENSGVEP
jgi:hypothetical protein